MSMLLSDTVTVSQAELKTQFDNMQSHFNDQPYLPLYQRIYLLKSLKRKLLTLEADLVAASSKDFGYRTAFDTVLGDILPTVRMINHTISYLPKWLKDSPRKAGLSLAPSKVAVSYQPKGVVGVISPWNYPVQLSIVPVITAIAAGNRVLLKVSEFTEHINKVLQNLFTGELAQYCVVIEGDAHTSQQFSSLPFAHLFITGSTAVGRKVMAAASQNLTPVTLELGGKSPVIITEQADIDKAAKAILFGKMTNAGQICVAPDYVLIPEKLQYQFVKSLCSLYKKHYKLGVEGKNLTSIISFHHFQRLTDLLANAKEQGAQIIKPLDENQTDEHKHRLGLHVVTDVNDTMKIMQEELFGPILPIIAYQQLSDAIAYINQRPHPLALYVMGQDKKLNQHIKQQTHSGTFAVNETLLQVIADDVPFGGLGPSGMGNYHGKEGFLTFSHARNTLKTGRFNPKLGLLLSQNTMLIKLLKWLYFRP